MVTKVSGPDRKHRGRGGRVRRRPKKDKLAEKRRDVETEEEEVDDADDDNGEGSYDEAYADEASTNDEEPASKDDEVCEEAEDGTRKCRKRRHIHPCICDLSKQVKQKVAKYLQRKSQMQDKYATRVKEIEEELARIEEERLETEREAQEQDELFGDEYEVVGKKKKRKKRSARRASMVSLGVKQVINWRKQPKNPVKYNLASELRSKSRSYCGIQVYPLTPVQEINFRKSPSLAVRSTWASTSRSKTNAGKKESLSKTDNKVPFVTPYYV